MNIKYPDFREGTHACADEDTDVFFRHENSQHKEAEAICSGCELQTECFSYAIAHAVEGYWGNTGSGERNRIRRLLKLTPISVEASMAEMFDGVTPHAAASLKHGRKAAEKWEAMPLDEALAARDQVFAEVEQSQETVRELGRRNRKFTDEQIREIRAATGSGREIGERFGVNNTTINKIRNRKVYADVA